jgi:hypothetical protein
MIILFNGPPGSGKDDACELLEKYKFTHLSFKHALYKSVCEFYNVNYDWFMKGYAIRDIKENKREQSLGWKTRRQAMIYVAEEHIKPTHGKGYYGRQVANQIDPTKNYCISDLGYVEELEAVVNKVGEENVKVVQIEREGYDFACDRRRYVGNVNAEVLPVVFDVNKRPKYYTEFLETTMNVETFKIYNNSTLKNFHRNVHYILFMLLEEGKNYECSI